MDEAVKIFDNCIYDEEFIYGLLPDDLFECLKTAKSVVLKPNWVKHSHIEREGDWDYIVTHPSVITAVLMKVLDFMPKQGKITIMDGPEMTTNFDELISHYPVERWSFMALQKDISLTLLDLREDIWYDNGEVVIKRERKMGDPSGSVETNLKGDLSEFYLHKKSPGGYFGADSDIRETNLAHDGINNLYRVSKTAIECDVFINLPKLKTHKKSGITVCLKNLVGINTYRNFLPHYSIGNRASGGDQFPFDSIKRNIESTLNPIFHQYIRTNPFLSRIFTPVMKLGRVIFESNKKTNRSGSWYGNDTIWRMILDINKILLYCDSDGTLRAEDYANQKKYIGIVDAVLCGEGYGPKTPDPKMVGYIIAGSNPVSIDAVCAKIMGFEPLRIPVIKNAFLVNRYRFINFDYSQIKIAFRDADYQIDTIPTERIFAFEPASGWKNYVENNIISETN